VSPTGLSDGGELGTRGSGDGAPIIVAFGFDARCTGGVSFHPEVPGPTAGMSCSVGAPSGM
jgi:hypothetical protein